jgi:excisionase family DNA binding protein
VLTAPPVEPQPPAGIGHNQPPSQPLAYRIPEAARAVGISPSKMKRMVGSGEVGSVVRGRMRIITADALRAWLGSGS